MQTGDTIPVPTTFIRKQVDILNAVNSGGVEESLKLLLRAAEEWLPGQEIALATSPDSGSHIKIHSSKVLSPGELIEIENYYRSEIKIYQDEQGGKEPPHRNENFLKPVRHENITLLKLAGRSGFLGIITIKVIAEKKKVEIDEAVLSFLKELCILVLEKCEGENEDKVFSTLLDPVVNSSDTFLKELIEQAPVAIAVFKGEDMIVEVANDYYLEIVGKTREDLIGRSIYKSLTEAVVDIEPLTRQIFETGKPLATSETAVHIFREGKLQQRYFNTLGKPVFNASGKVQGIVVIAHETTDLVISRHTIQDEHHNIRSIIESAPFPIGVYVGREMKIQFANRSIMDVWGKGYDVTGKTYSEVLPELANQKVYEQLDDVFTTGIPYHAKNQRIDLVVAGKLQPFYFNYSFTPLYNLAGEIYGVMNTAADVTELVQAYKKLEESEERARLAIEASEQGTFHFDLLTGELMPSVRMAEIFDLPHSTNRKDYLDAVLPEDLEVRDEAFKVAYKTGSLAYDARIRKKNGSISWVRVKGKIYFDGGKAQKIVGIIYDITEQKNFSALLEQKVEERTVELAALNKKLLAMNDELQQFAYVASHDMQEPLRKIRVFSDILAGTMDDANNREASYVKKINAAAERMTGLIKGLLEYSKTSDTNLRQEKVDLNVLVKAVLTDFELLSSQKNADIQMERLPVIMAVPLQMNQLFYNLIGNALKFTREDVKPVIKIRAFEVTDELLSAHRGLNPRLNYCGISIEDNGTGFDQAYATKIFTVFQRLNEKDKFGGYGIGLALCKKVVEEHRGVIYVDSETGIGSKFSLILPTEGI